MQNISNDENISPEIQDDIDSGYQPEVDDAPLDIAPPDRRLVTQPYDLSVRTLLSQIEDKSLIVEPPYQRGYVWDDKRASRLIESLLMNVPIPPCYFAEEEIGISSVIDGHQRLRSIWRYRYGNFKLQGLRTHTEYNGRSWEDLGEREQRLILGRSIRCIVIALESHPEIRFEVFERLNTGSVPLTDQEIRNAIYRGELIALIRSLADQPRWLEVLNKNKLDKRMRDDELVLRFLAVYERYADYQAPLRSFLNTYTRDNRKLDEQRKQKLTRVFVETVDKVKAVFGDHAFRTHRMGIWEKQINRALFDAIMLVFSQLPKDRIVRLKQEIEIELIKLFDDPAFAQAIGRSTADRASFVLRVKMFSEAMAKIGLDSKIHGKIGSA